MFCAVTFFESDDGEAMTFKFIVPKGHKDIFRFSSFPRTIAEWNKLPKETVTSQSLSIFKSKLC